MTRKYNNIVTIKIYRQMMNKFTILMILGRCPNTNIHWSLPLFHRTLPYANDFRALPYRNTVISSLPLGRSPLIITVGRSPARIPEHPSYPLGRSPLINTVGQRPAKIPTHASYPTGQRPTRIPALIK